VQKLIADYNDNPNLAKGLLQIGEEYYQKASWCKKRELEGQWQEYFRRAVAVWDRIVLDLPTGDYTDDACYYSGRSYELLGEYEGAIAYYEQVVAGLPGGTRACEAQYRIARCYHELRMNGGMDIKEAIAKKRKAVEKLVAEYPDCELVGLAIGLVGGPDHFRFSGEGENK